MNLKNDVKRYSQLLYDDKWVQLKRVICPEHNIFGYTYSHEIRCDGKIIVCLPFKVEDEKLFFLLRKEATPCWELYTPMLSSITGGVDKNMTEEETAVKELKEETGYRKNIEDLINLGISYSTKSSDTVYSIFSVDLSDYEDEIDNLEVETELDKSSTCEWVESEDILNCMDPFVSVAYIRLLNRLFTDKSLYKE